MYLIKMAGLESPCLAEFAIFFFGKAAFVLSKTALRRHRRTVPKSVDTVFLSLARLVLVNPGKLAIYHRTSHLEIPSNLRSRTELAPTLASVEAFVDCCVDKQNTR